MTTLQHTPKYRLYPAYCFRASPTYHAWVKLTAVDVHALYAEPDFQGQGIYFFYNHPIRFVRLVGVVVAIDDIFSKYTILTLDDGSGATIEVKIIRLSKDEYNAVESPSNTHITNVNVVSDFGIFDVTIDGRLVDIGTVLKAKCTLSEFRGNKQLELKRVSIIESTNEEAKAWAETAAFKRDVLMTPWHISKRQHENIRKEIKAERKKEEEYERKKREHEARKKLRKREYDEYMKKWYEKHERERRKEELVMNSGALI
ncbi:hypothetical protein GQ43DRAFT_390210 [Delitschia confertaspora ATCC 74209]|uniref:CST complex subunit Stn1 N-terminal domain-containing protein n=1 Tax=Delitschia confertaspora ATCC 74209 TaxID=1513339 RepID=A0A9P4MRT3_9PLEO|nr:hypothetical protein GQ43DRAFT_390210 [Delitschia confertaspora ATCC 74209]